LQIYGVRAQRVAALAQARPGAAARIPGTAALRAEVVLAFEEEFARTLSDVMERRMMVSRNEDLGLDCVEEVARTCRCVAGWDRGRTEQEVDAYRHRVRSMTLAAQ
ncbi:MAG: glycerol-3-phosphate dehydrogenase C-terminal domain-containing protein, partial [Sciscionella sp.]